MRPRALSKMLLDEGTGLVAVKPRHHNVDKDDVGLVLGDLGQRLKAIRCRNHLAALLLEQVLRRSADRLAVVDDHDLQPLKVTS